MAVVKNTFSGIFFKEKRTLHKWTLWFGTKFPGGILINRSKSCSSSIQSKLGGSVSISSGDKWRVNTVSQHVRV